MPETNVILDATAIQRALTRIAHEIAERNEISGEVVLVGIPVGGDHLAQRLSQLLAEIWHQPVPVGILDVSMHRDDLDQRAAPKVYPTVIPFDVTGKTVVLVDRGHRELPIKADFVGKNVPTAREEKISLCLTENGAERDEVVLLKK